LDDPVDNRTFSTEAGISTAYSVDANDRLVSAGGETYSYNGNGNLLTTSVDSTVITNTYDARDKLIQSQTEVAAVVTDTTSFTYDVDGNRVTRNHNGTATQYVVDRNQQFAQVLNELDGTGALQTSYVYGDDLIKQRRAANDSYYHYDGLGSTRALSNTAAAITDTYAYNAYGQLIDQTGTTANDYLFTGEQFDAALNNYYLRARYYDPASGRFTQMDTFPGVENDPVTLHKYLYANIDPINNSDPSGRFSLASFSAAQTINVVLTAISIGNTAIDVFQFATGEKELTPRQAGSIILMALAGPVAGKVILKSFSRVCRNSFTGDTLVHTEDGLIPIKELSIGEKVWSLDGITGKEGWNDIVHLIKGTKKYDLIIIELENGNLIEATDDHPIYTTEIGWKLASDLRKDDIVLLRSGEFTTITSVSSARRADTVYNLTVANAHTYYVGTQGLLAHNCPDDIKGFLKKIKENQERRVFGTVDTKDADRTLNAAFERVQGTVEGKRNLLQNIARVLKNIFDIQ